MSNKRERSSDEDAHEAPRASKRSRPSPPPSAASHDSSSSSLPSSSAPPHDYLTVLSDELLVRILHLLSLSSVLTIQRVSHRFQRLARDGQVWKGLYYERFVRPRARRLRGGGGGGAGGGDGAVEWDFASRDARWLDELADTGRRRAGEHGAGVDWKKRFKLRFNWSRGSAALRSIGLGSREGESSSLHDDNDDGTGLNTAMSAETRSKQDQQDGSDGESGSRLRDSSPNRQVMVKLVNGIVVTADAGVGLRAWNVKSADTGKECLAKLSLYGPTTVNISQPTCIAVDSIPETDLIDIAVGFDNGGLGIWRLNIGHDSQRSQPTVFTQLFRRDAIKGTSHSKALCAMAFAHPYLLTSTEDHVLSLYTLEAEVAVISNDKLQRSIAIDDEPVTAVKSIPDRSTLTDYEAPRLLASLKSHTSWPPISLSIRPAPRTVIASIAYALPTYLNGWSVGLQELHLSKTGEILHSRLATAVEAGFHSLLSSSPIHSAFSTPPPSPKTDGRGIGVGVSASASSRPTSLSYTHPYLLATHADNTLTLYLVVSNDEELRIGNGTKLWGHTSGVVGAMIGGRGRAVSVGGLGGEVRVWELEGGRSRGRKGADGERSIRIEGKSVGGLDHSEEGGLNLESKGWVGFDDELVVVMRGLDRAGNDEGAERLLVYDFT